MKRRVAVVGAGLAGLGTAWHLCQYQHLEVVVFDPKGVGGGASGVSTGLMHPFAGKRALRSWGAKEGMEATEKLIAISEAYLGRSVAEKTGIFRPAVTAQQKADFFARSQEDEDAIWKEHSLFGAGLWIPKGITLYSRLYLEGLWKGCQAHGASLDLRSISLLEELNSFDAIVIAAGFQSTDFAKDLPLESTKGQTLLCRWPERLECSIVSQGHITPAENPQFCYVGSTYEHGFNSLEPDPSAADVLVEKAEKFYPSVRTYERIEVRSGVRTSRPRAYRPILEKLSTHPSAWVFTGLGSRGVLYHAWLGSQLAETIAAAL